MTINTLLPPNAPKGDRVLEAAIARASSVPVDFPKVWDPATCPPALLPWLAWGLSVDVWDAAWPEALKRQMIAESIERQRRKGSARAVREILDAFGVGLTLHEWFDRDFQGQPHTFEVRLPIEGGETVLASFVEGVADQVTRVKPASAHFTIAQTLTAAGDVGLLAVGRAAAARRLDVGQVDGGDWSGVLLTEDGEPFLTEADEPLEIDD